MVGPEAIVKQYITVAAQHSPKALLPYLSAASVAKVKPMIPTRTDDSQAIPPTVVPKFTVGKFKLEGADAVVPVDLEVPGQNGAAARTIQFWWVHHPVIGNKILPLTPSWPRRLWFPGWQREQTTHHPVARNYFSDPSSRGLLWQGL